MRLGAVASGLLKGTALTAVFAGVALLVALNMAFKRDGVALRDGLPGTLGTAFIGGGIGGLSTLMGIGGGTLSVPILNALRVPMHRAVGTGALLGTVISVPGALAFVINGLGVPLRPPFSLGYVNGLGFTMKWNMGWMHDMLRYFSVDPVYRKHHQNDITFSMLYAFTENFVLPISHDEVVYGKKALVSKMPGDEWQRFANVRAFLSYMYGHPGKKLLFMGSEFGQGAEWNASESLDWHLLDVPDHAGVRALVRDLNRLYREHPALWESDHEPAGFEWIDADDADENVIAFRRIAPSTGKTVVAVCNFAPVPRIFSNSGSICFSSARRSRCTTQMLMPCSASFCAVASPKPDEPPRISAHWLREKAMLPPSGRRS